MRSPAQMRSLFDESLREEVGEKELNQPADVLDQLRGMKEYLPSPKPVLPGGRAPQPHAIAVTDSECSENTCSCIRNQSRVKMSKSTAAQINQQDQHRRDYDSPKHSAMDISSTRPAHVLHLLRL